MKKSEKQRHWIKRLSAMVMTAVMVMSVMGAVEPGAVQAAGVIAPGQTADTNDLITINLFDYNSNTSTKKASDHFYENKANEKNNNFKFISSSESAEVNKNNQGALQGIVETKLNDNGFPKLTGEHGVNKEGELNLDYLFKANGQYESMNREFTNQNNLFLYDQNTKTYSYDSDKNAAKADISGKSDNRFTLYQSPYHLAWPNQPTSECGAFLPFNDPNGNDMVINSQAAYYHFGMTMETTFIMPPDGKIVNSETGKTENMVFSFSGDDDVWVFIDDVLFLDIGGIHGRVGGTINFSEGNVNVDNVYYGDKNKTFEKLNEEADKSLDLDENGKFKPNTEHKLSFFYLERGAGESNCSLSFNLELKPSLGFRKVDKNNNIPLAGAEFTLYNEKNCSPESRVTTAVSNNSGGFNLNFFEKNDNTDSGNGDKAYVTSGETYYLKETGLPNGYIPDIDEQNAVWPVVFQRESKNSYYLIGHVYQPLQEGKDFDPSNPGEEINSIANRLKPKGAELKFKKVDNGTNAIISSETAEFTLTKQGEETPLKTYGIQNGTFSDTLAPGTYTLTETTAPDGYSNAPQNVWTITVTETPENSGEYTTEVKKDGESVALDTTDQAYPLVNTLSDLKATYHWGSCGTAHQPEEVIKDGDTEWIESGYHMNDAITKDGTIFHPEPPSTRIVDEATGTVYKFKHWNTALDGTDIAVSKNGNILNENGSEGKVFTFGTEDVHLYAQWEIEKLASIQKVVESLPNSEENREFFVTLQQRDPDGITKSFRLKAGEVPTTFDLPLGEYTIKEAPVTGYRLQKITVTGMGDPQDIFEPTTPAVWGSSKSFTVKENSKNVSITVINKYFGGGSHHTTDNVITNDMLKKASGTQN